MKKNFMTAVIQLPDDPVSRDEIVTALRVLRDFHGGRVTAVYAGDAISENEQFEEIVGPTETQRVRDKVAAL